MNYFISKNDIELNWQDVLWGSGHHFLGGRDVVNYAKRKVIEEFNYDE